jgi:hypothetical protein
MNNYGGVQNYIMNLYRSIDRNKLQFDFLILSNDRYGYYDNEITSMGGRVYYVSEFQEKIFKYLKEIEFFLRNNKKNILQLIYMLLLDLGLLMEL